MKQLSRYFRVIATIKNIESFFAGVVVTKMITAVIVVDAALPIDCTSMRMDLVM